jgi:RNA polymerase sigma-70 factor (ECF subfamily)
MQELNVTRDEFQAFLARAQGGEREASDRLLEEHRGRLETWVRRQIGARLRSRADAEDIVQDTFLRAFESIGRFSWTHDDSFFQWLCAIARHLIWNASQRGSSRELSLSIDPPQRGAAPSTAMRREERFDRLERALRDLRPEEREVVRLARMEGLKAREIAERLGRPEPTVRSLLARAFRKLRDSIGETRSLHLPDRKLHFGGPNGD